MKSDVQNIAEFQVLLARSGYLGVPFRVGVFDGATKDAALRLWEATRK